MFFLLRLHSGLRISLTAKREKESEINKMARKLKINKHLKNRLCRVTVILDFVNRLKGNLQKRELLQM